MGDENEGVVRMLAVVRIMKVVTIAGVVTILRGGE